MCWWYARPHTTTSPRAIKMRIAKRGRAEARSCNVRWEHTAAVQARRSPRCSLMAMQHAALGLALVGQSVFVFCVYILHDLLHGEIKKIAQIVATRYGTAAAIMVP